MRRLGFRLKTLMLLVLLAALGTAAGLHLARLEPDAFIGQLAILGPFLVLVVLKMGLAFASRLARSSREEATRRPLEGRSPSPSSSEFTKGG